MQSIYRFRGADVSVYMFTRDHGFGHGMGDMYTFDDFSAPDAEIGLSQTVSFRLQITAGFLFKASADLSFVQLFLSGGNGRKQGGNAVLCFR